jgi:arginine exporter protein ArgO
MTDVLPGLGAGILAGLGVAMPLGAMGVLVVEIGRRTGFREGAAAGLGVAGADGLYATAAVLGGAAAASLLAPVEDEVRLLSAAVLVAVAAWLLWSLRRPVADGPPQPRALHHTSLRFLALTVVNPPTAAYFAALVVGLPAVAAAAAPGKAAFVIGAFAASLGWQTGLAGVGAVLHRRLPERARVWTGVAGALLVLAFAARTALVGLDA